MEGAPFRNWLTVRVDHNFAAGDGSVDAFLGKQDEKIPLISSATHILRSSSAGRQNQPGGRRTR